MPGLGSISFNTKKIGEDSTVNNEFMYDISTSPWQMIRPSFLVFLNNRLPINHSPWSHGSKLLNVCEVGVAGGMNAKLMLRASVDIFLYGVDCYEHGQTSESAIKSCEPYKDRFKMIEKRSVDAVKEFPDNFFDYVYIDAAHDYENVKKDLIAWYPKVKLGTGIIAGHDFFLGDVRKAVVEFFDANVNPQRLWAVTNIFDPRMGPEHMNSDEGQFADWWTVKLAVTKA